MSSVIISKADGECKRVDRISDGRCRGNIDPEVGSPADDLKEAVEIGSFCQVAVGVELVCLANVLSDVGGRENRDGDEAEGGIGFKRAQKVERTAFRQVEIEKDETGTRRRIEFTLAFEEAHRLFPVDGHINSDGRFESAQGFLHQANIGRIIFNDQDVSGEQSLYSTLRSKRKHAGAGTSIRQVGVVAVG